MGFYMNGGDMSVPYDEMSLYDDDQGYADDDDYVDLYDEESDEDDGPIQNKLSLIAEESSASVPDVPDIPMPNQV